MDDAARGSSERARPAHAAAAQQLARASAHARRGDVRRALADVRDALARAPRSAEVLVHAAHVFLQLAYRDKALRVLRAAERCAPAPAVAARLAALRHAAEAPASAPPPPSGAPRLPPETLVQILGYLDFASLCAAAGVCRAWRQCACAHSALWHTLVVGRASGSAAPAKVRLQRQRALLALYLRRGARQVRDVTLVPPLADTSAVRDVLQPAALTTLTVHCQHAHAAAWVAWAVQIPTLAALAVHAHGAETHAWLAPPLDVGAARCTLRRLALHGTPPLADDDATRRVCARLERLAYSAPAGVAALRPLRAQWAPAVQRLVRHAQHTLTELVLDGDAVWAIDAFAAPGAAACLPALHTLHAPLKCLGAAAALPALTTLGVQVSPPHAPDGTRAALLRFAASVARSVRHGHLRITRDSPTGLVAALLRLWTPLETLTVTWDDAVHAEAPALARAHELQRPLTAALLVRLLTPGALVDDVLCPALHTLALGADATLRGRELCELVGMRVLLAQRCSVAAARDALAQRRLAARAPDVDAPLAARIHTLDVAACRELAPEAVAFLRPHCDVRWSADAAERARHAARAPRSARDRLAGIG